MGQSLQCCRKLTFSWNCHIILHRKFADNPPSSPKIRRGSGPWPLFLRIFAKGTRIPTYDPDIYAEHTGHRRWKLLEDVKVSVKDVVHMRQHQLLDKSDPSSSWVLTLSKIWYRSLVWCPSSTHDRCIHGADWARVWLPLPQDKQTDKVSGYYADTIRHRISGHRARSLKAHKCNTVHMVVGIWTNIMILMYGSATKPNKLLPRPSRDFSPNCFRQHTIVITRH